VSLYYSLAENSGVVTDQLGVYISKTIEDVANDDDGKTSFNMKPASVETPEGVALQNSGQWNQMCGVYKAAGGEEFITISRYAPRKSDFTRRHVKVKGLANAAYYYIDNVQVVPISKDASCVCELSEKEKMELWTRKLKDGNTLELEDIQFDFNKSDLLPASYTALNTLVTILKAEPSMKIEIDGHTDAEGTKERNLELSKERARAVAAYLVSKGIDKTRIQTKGYGDTQPKSDNQTKHGRAINRRVEVKIVR
ncbi:MAG: OmpA family protein, partial [Flavobacteriales bacterium]|nr:OmpA family protein [Flavobacteriales bacterium]